MSYYVPIKLAAFICKRNKPEVIKLANQGKIDFYKEKSGEIIYSVRDLKKNRRKKKEDLAFKKIKSLDIYYENTSKGLKEKWHKGSFKRFEFSVSTFGRIKQENIGTKKRKLLDHYIKNGRQFVCAIRPENTSLTTRIWVEDIVCHVYGIKRLNEKKRGFKVMYLDADKNNYSPYNIVYADIKTFLKKKFIHGYMNSGTIKKREEYEFQEILNDLQQNKKNFIKTGKTFKIKTKFVILIYSNYI